MKIAVLGHGVVGGGVSEIVDTRFTGPENPEVAYILVPQGSDRTDPRMTDCYEDILEDDSVLVVAECIGGLEPARTYVKQALERGKHVVTSNKKMLATFFKELAECAAAHHVTIRFEATCGGGIPWMAALERLRRVDEVISFRGILNGTTNYILSNMSETGMAFSDALEQAQKLGYAEADPTDDIDGYDVGYKCCLSAVQAFGALIDPADIPVFGIRQISAADIAWARKHHKTIKLIGSGFKTEHGISLSVMPEFLDEKSVLAALRSNLNGIEAVSTTLGPSTYIGQGAGRYPTAHAVVQDMMTIAQNPHAAVTSAVERELDLSGLSGRYYLSAEEVLPEEIRDPEVTDGFVTRFMALRGLMDLLKSRNLTKVFVAKLSDD